MRHLSAAERNEFKQQEKYLELIDMYESYQSQDNTENNMKNIPKLYDFCSSFYINERITFINFLLMKIEAKNIFAKKVYVYFYRKEKIAQSSYNLKNILGYKFDMQIKYCMDKLFMHSLKFLFKVFSPNEIPNMLLFSLETNDKKLFYQCIDLIHYTETSEILHTIPYLKITEEEMMRVSNVLLNKNIGTLYMTRGLSAALESQKRNLFLTMLKHPSVDLTDWNYFIIRESLFYGEFPLAIYCITHKSISKNDIDYLYKEYRENRINTPSEKIKNKILDIFKMYYNKTLTYPSELKP